MTYRYIHRSEINSQQISFYLQLIVVNIETYNYNVQNLGDFGEFISEWSVFITLLPSKFQVSVQKRT